MSSKKQKIMVQLDTDLLPSTFDSIVGVDSGVDCLISHGGVTADNLIGLLHGTMFTRSPNSLRNTMVFFGGSDVAMAKQLFDQARGILFDPFRVSLALDPSGCNTTAAVAVCCSLRHFPSILSVPSTTSESVFLRTEVKKASELKALILGGTGAVGSRIATVLGALGLRVTLASRSIEKGLHARSLILDSCPDAAIDVAKVGADDFSSEDKPAGGSAAYDLVFSCGAAGKTLLSQASFDRLCRNRCVLIDLNAVPPAGICGLSPTAKGMNLGEAIGYGAIGVGGFKMQLHQQMIRCCFESNHLCFDLNEIFELSKQLLH